MATYPKKPKKPATSRQLTVYDGGIRYPDLPLIRLTGQWLQQAGFKKGDPIQVEITPDGLVIRHQEKIE